MKKVRLITADDNNGKIAISRTPIRNRFFFDGEWHEITVTTKPEILKDANLHQTMRAIYSELPDTFYISAFIEKTHLEMFDCKRQPKIVTIDRRVRELRELGYYNYEVVNSAKGTYRKLPVISKTCDQQVKIEFKTDVEKRFIEFLKAEGAYEKYCNNLLSERKMSITEYCDNTLSELNETYLTSGPFIYSYTPEGHSYWWAINVKWEEICKTL